MVYRSKKPFAARALCFLLAAWVFFVGLVPPSSVSATSGTATTSSQIGTSMYDVSTALTAFANYVVGPNSNDKHGDVVVGGAVDANRSFKLWELSDAADASKVKIGGAGCFIGYGDASKGFVGYLMSNATNSVTTSSYGSYADQDTAGGGSKNLGDNGKSYTYVRYGRLLNDLGIDEMGNPSGTGWDRGSMGVVLQGVYIISSFIPKLFEIAFRIMDTLNPFRFLIGAAAGETYGDVAIGTEMHGASGSAVTTDPWNGTQQSGGVATGSVKPQDIDGLDRNQTKDGTAIPAALKPIFSYVTDIYMRLRGIGLWVVMPLMTVLLLAGIFLFNRSNAWPNVQKYCVRFVFIVVGIPFLGIIYTSVLHEFQDMLVTQNRPSTRIVASTLVDFENWCKTRRLDPPKTIPANGLKSEKGTTESEAQGKTYADSWRQVRPTIYQINYSTGLYSLNPDGQLGVGYKGTGDNYYTYAGMWNVDNGSWQPEHGNADVWTPGVSTDQKHFDRIGAMIGSYLAGDFYTASAWESNVNAYITANWPTQIGTSVATAASSAIEKTVYQMYSDTDDVNDWFNRQQEENAQIFAGTAAGTSTLQWVGQEWNIFSNGGTLGATAVTSYDQDVTYTGETSMTNGINPHNEGGLSTITMYNYLSTAFNESNVATYSAQNTTSEYTRLQHYSVNLAGTGVTRVAFVLNVVVVLGIYVILGVYYALGMVISVLKHGFSMIMSIPAAMFGVIKSIAQVVAYVVQMVTEILSSCWLYQVIMELVLVFATVVETPVMNALNNLTASSVAGGVFAQADGLDLVAAVAGCRPWFTVALFFMCGLTCLAGYGLLILGKAYMKFFLYVHYRFAYLLTFDEFKPWFAGRLRARGRLDVWDGLKEDARGAAGRLPGAVPGKGGVAV